MPENKNRNYEVHVFLTRDEGYSRFFQTCLNLETEEDIINYAIEYLEGFAEDADYVDYAQEISKEEYYDAVDC